jgi:CheY-like chemotaxis protein
VPAAAYRVAGNKPAGICVLCGSPVSAGMTVERKPAGDAGRGAKNVKHAEVLIVDDDRDLADSLADFIEANGYKACVASNGQEAIERYREHDFDMAFMDVRMPVMNGVDSFLEIRRLRPDAKIVMMTGFREPIVEKALQGGAAGLLLKPFELSDLLKNLRDAEAPSEPAAAAA